MWPLPDGLLPGVNAVRLSVTTITRSSSNYQGIVRSDTD